MTRYVADFVAPIAYHLTYMDPLVNRVASVIAISLFAIPVVESAIEKIKTTPKDVYFSIFYCCLLTAVAFTTGAIYASSIRHHEPMVACATCETCYPYQPIVESINYDANFNGSTSNIGMNYRVSIRPGARAGGANLSIRGRYIRPYFIYPSVLSQFKVIDIGIHFGVEEALLCNCIYNDRCVFTWVSVKYLCTLTSASNS